MKLIQRILTIGCIFFLIQHSYAQTHDKVELLPGTRELIGTIVKGKEVRKLIGNVGFKQKETLLYCDSAYLHKETDFIEAFGNVRILQGDSVTITGNNGTYNGQNRQAKMWGNVVLKDKTMTLTTGQLDYDMNSNIAYYPNNGTIVDGENVLTSKEGYYNTQTKIFTFKQNVKLVNPSYTLTSDNLQYNSVSKIAYFNTATKIVGKDGTLIANEGDYNTVTQVSNFKGRSAIEYTKYTLTGDVLFYDKKNEIGLAEGNVVLTAKEDSTVIEGDYGRYFGKQGISKVYGHALMKNIVSQDTLFLTADTLLSVDDNTQKKSRKLYAYQHVKIFKTDLQGKCDSLLYNFTDSTIYFYRDPVLWSDASQLFADSVQIQMAYNKINKMYLRSNAFVISQDTLKNYNQMKGRQMIAFFNNKSKMERVNVNGNGENITFVLNDDNTQLRGVNKVECSNMVIKLLDSKIKNVSFINKPDAVFIPPHEIEEPSTRLKGFIWREKERPARQDVMIRTVVTKVPDMSLQQKK